jgi:D-alanyl-D-alanine carboxypeptidase (penicillin-binding protein 5/6)
MCRTRSRRNTALLFMMVLLMSPTGQAGAAAGRAPGTGSTPSPSPSPFAMPTATSTIGGAALRDTRTLTDLPDGVRPPPVPKAAAWLVADLDSRQILAGRRVHVPLAPASTLKIFTALAVAPRLNPDAVYTAQDADAAIDGSKVGLVPGSRYRVRDLLHGLLMGSGNDCASALGTLAGGQRAAVGLMAAQARRLGALDTVPVNTSGLDAERQVSSAYDLALAGSAALSDRRIAAVLRTTAYPFPAAGRSLGSKRKHFQIQNHNRLLRNVDGATGVKNGYTVTARGSFVGSAARGGHRYLAVVLRMEGSGWHATRDLLEWAFAEGRAARRVGVLVRPGEVPDPGPSSTQGGAGTPGTGDAGAGAPSLLPTDDPGLRDADDGPLPDLSAGIGGWTAGLTALVGALGGAGVMISRRRRAGPSSGARHNS